VTDVNGVVTVTAQGFNDATIDGEDVTLVPLIDATTPADINDAGRSLFGWRCGSAGDGTTIPSKFLPGSCRG
jgi:type IV pilus assembly protein PilA